MAAPGATTTLSEVLVCRLSGSGNADLMSDMRREAVIRVGHCPVTLGHRLDAAGSRPSAQMILTSLPSPSAPSPSAPACLSHDDLAVRIGDAYAVCLESHSASSTLRRTLVRPCWGSRIQKRRTTFSEESLSGVALHRLSTRTLTAQACQFLVPTGSADKTRCHRGKDHPGLRPWA